MLEQQRNYRLFGRIIDRVQLELVELLVLADQISDWPFKDVNYSFERFTCRRRFEVFDGVKRDTTLGQQRNCATRMASTRIVIERYTVHRCSSRLSSLMTSG